jgi:multidrug efflux pump
VKQEFIPKEDRGAFFVMVNGPEGATYKYMEEYMTEIERRLMAYVEENQVSRLLIRTPRGFDTLSNFNDGMAIVLLEDWSKRRPAAKIMAEIREELSDLPGVRVFTIMRQGLGGSPQKPVQFVLGGSTYEELAQWRDILFEKIAENNPGLIGLDSSYKETRPQIDFKINYDRAAQLGVSIEEIGTTLETMMGGRRVTTFLDRGEEYDVIVEGERAQQRSFDQVKNIYVRSDRTGSMIPLSNLVTIKEYGAAKTLTRYNRIRAITIEANLKEGYRLDEALTYLNGMVKKHLPEIANVDYKGESRDFMTSGSSMVFVFVLGLLVVFLVLAAQFESYIHPFVIMLTVPLAMGGGLFGLYLTDSSLNIYSQIALIILVGLSAKNGILIVEFANQLRDRGVEFSQALIQAAEIRFRPILMTGLTTIAGAIPLVISSGAGSETRLVIGIVILSGVFAATIFTLFIVPVAYNLLARHTSSPRAVADKLVKEETEKVKL